MRRLAPLSISALLAILVLAPAGAQAAPRHHPKHHAALRVKASVPTGITARRRLTVAGSVSGHRPNGRARLQQRAHGHWRARGRWARVHGRHHRFRLRWRAPRHTGRYALRVEVAAGKRRAHSRRARVTVLPHHGVKGARVVLGAGQIDAAPAPGTNGRLRLSGPVSVAKGDVIAAGITPRTPSGFLGIATSVRQKGNETLVATRPATLEEAVPSGDINVAIGSGHAGHARTAADRKSIDKKVTCEGGGTVGVEGYAKVTPSAHFQAHWHWSPRHSGVDRASFDASVNAKAGVTASAAGSASCKLADQQIAQLHPQPISVWVGPIPVVLVPRVTVYVSADAAAGASATTGIDASATARAGLEYDHGSLSAIHEFDHHFTATPPTAAASAHLGAHLKPVFDLLLYGVAGPEASFDTGLSFDADTTKTPWWTVSAPVRLAARLKVPVLDLSSNEWEVYKHAFDLAHATGAAPGASTPPASPPTSAPPSAPPLPATPPPPQRLARTIYNYWSTEDLQCTLETYEDADHEFFTDEESIDACGTFLAVDGELYGPSTIPAGESVTGDDNYQYWTPESQTLDGDGTSANPYRLLTTVAAGDTGIELTETDTWVDGGNSVHSTYAITGDPGDTRSVRLYRAADCYVGDDDDGYGTYRPATATVGCLRDNGDNTETEMALVPETAGATVVEAFFDDVWQMVAAQAPLPNTCRCDENIDNGFADSWAARLAGATPVHLGSRFDFVTTD